MSSTSELIRLTPSAARKEQDEVSKRPRWRALFSFTITKHSTPLCLALLLSVLSGIVPPVLSVLLGNIFDVFQDLGIGKISSRKFEEDMVRNCLYLVGLGCGSWILNGGFFSLWLSFGELQARSSRGRVFDGLLEKPISWYDTQEVGLAAFVSRIEVHIRELQLATSQPLGFVVQNVATATTALALALYYCWNLALVTLATIPVGAIILLFVSSKIQPIVQQQQNQLVTASKIITNAISAIETVKSFNSQAIEAAKYKSDIQKAAKYYILQATGNAFQIGFIRFMILAMFVQGFWYGSHIVATGSKSTGTVITTFWSVLTATQAIEHILPQMITLEKGRIAGSKLRSLTSDTCMHKDVIEPDETQQCRGDIEFRNVSFTYPAQPNLPALLNLSCRFVSGQTTFLVGKSGSGKSTLQQLLLRFYQPDVGSIYLDGKPLNSFDIHWLRRNITLVEQQTILFQGTVFENIAMGGNNPARVSMEDMEEAINFAAMREAVKELKKGFGTLVSHKGNDLSGGQKQRIALARARLRDSTILILDESTSALDAVSKSAFMTALREWRRGKTTLIITHDTSQIEEDDLVCLIDGGRVVESGYWGNLGLDNTSPFARFSPRSPPSVQTKSTTFSDDLMVETLKTQESRDFSGQDVPTDRSKSTFSHWSTEGLDGREAVVSSPTSIYSVGLPRIRGRTRRSNSLYCDSPSLLADFSCPGSPTSVYSPRQPPTNGDMEEYRDRPSHHQSLFSAPYMPTMLGNRTVRSAIFQPFTLTRSEMTKSSSNTRPKLPSTARLHERTSRQVATLLARENAQVRNGLLMDGPPIVLSPHLRRSIEKGRCSLYQATRRVSIWPVVSPAGAPPTIGDLLSDKPERESLRRILGTLWRRLDIKSRMLFIIGLCSAIVHAGATPVFSFAFAKLLATFFDMTNGKSNARMWSIFILAIAIVDGLATFLMHLLLERCGQSCVDGLRIVAARKVLAQPRKFFAARENSPPHITQTLDRSGEETRKLLGYIAGFAVVGIVMTAAAISWSLAVCWKLTLVTLTIVPVSYLITKAFQVVSSKMERQCNDAAGESALIFHEVFTSIKTVRALTLEEYFRQKHTSTTRDAISTGMKRAISCGLFFGISESLITFATALIFYYGAKLASSHEYSVQDIILVFAMLLFSMSNVSAIVAYIPQIQSSKDNAIRLLRLVGLDGTCHEDTGTLDVHTVRHIVIRNLSFAYETRPNDEVLRNLSITFASGTCTALVGRSGSGKSTLAALLLRYYPTNHSNKANGFIMVNGRDIQCYRTVALRSLISIVPQTPVVFAGTVFENISYGLPTDSIYRTSANVEAAAVAAGVHDFIQSLPDGYETVVGDGRMGLSGGQCQRIAIARSLVREPAVLILDEATSALDVESASLVRESVKKLVRERKEMTVIIITHHRDMMETAGRVVMMERGTVVEEGRFEELLEKSHGKFRKLLEG